mmetsp:Transcript_27670/g.31606  ORF Transcript_27670/g.31606 Transcript_27670/m.31606 type:complete len:123 (+) Transcript_27670:106-474(+)
MNHSGPNESSPAYDKNSFGKQRTSTTKGHRRINLTLLFSAVHGNYEYIEAVDQTHYALNTNTMTSKMMNEPCHQTNNIYSTKTPYDRRRERKLYKRLNSSLFFSPVPGNYQKPNETKPLWER